MGGKGEKKVTTGRNGCYLINRHCSSNNKQPEGSKVTPAVQHGVHQYSASPPSHLGHLLSLDPTKELVHLKDPVMTNS